MSIDWSHFTPASAFAGGAMIGAAAALLILGAGRVMGAAGIVAGALDPRDGGAAWRWALIAGLVAAPTLAKALWGAPPPVFAVHGALLLASGLLVGFGARLGSGCTSGHGVCGVARLSPRSLVATALFMASGFAAVFVVRHLVA